jgi:hypothetical protein
MNRPIKIVKLAERERRTEEDTTAPVTGGETGAESKPADTNLSRNHAREAADTIKGWIGDLRSEQRRTLEATGLHLSQAGLIYKPVPGRKRKTG